MFSSSQLIKKKLLLKPILKTKLFVQIILFYSWTIRLNLWSESTCVKLIDPLYMSYQILANSSPQKSSEILIQFLLFENYCFSLLVNLGNHFLWIPNIICDNRKRLFSLHNKFEQSSSATIYLYKHFIHVSFTLLLVWTFQLSNYDNGQKISTCNYKTVIHNWNTIIISAWPTSRLVQFVQLSKFNLITFMCYVTIFVNLRVT